MIDHRGPLAEERTSFEKRNVVATLSGRQVTLAAARPSTHQLSEGQAIFVANKCTIVLVLTLLFLLVYAIAGYATPKLISNSDSLLSNTLHYLVGLGTNSITVESSKEFDKTSIDAVQAAMPTFSRSWYIESSP